MTADPAVAGVAWDAATLLEEAASLLGQVTSGRPVGEVFRSVVDRLHERFPGSVCGSGGLDHFGRLDLCFPTLARPAELAVGEASIADPEVLGTEPCCILGPAADPRCAKFAHVLAELNVRSLWAHPLLGPLDPLDREHAIGASPVLGALVVMTPEARCPDDRELAYLDRCAKLLALALEREGLRARLEHGALHDELTGLPNRLLLIRRIAVAADRRRGKVALLFADLDQFKVVNDSLGHPVGDQLLCAVGERFARAVRPDDTVGRFGGDEFVVLCEGIDGRAEAVAVAGRLLEVLAEPLTVGSVRLNLSASIGIALLGDEDTGDDLLRNADLAMYRAKDLGRGRSVVYEPSFGTVVDQRLELEGALHQALDEKEFHVLYQPQVNLADGAIAGAETLVRWDRPGSGPVSPSLFVPVAEVTELVVPLGRWVLDQAVAEAATWPRSADGVPIPVSVNLAARHLADPALEDLVTEVLERHQLDPNLLCLEVTESDLVYDLASSASVMLRLKRLGVRLAIDDFGMGYATLDYVRRFSMADVLKIDASFVQGLSNEGDADRAIVAAALALGRTLGFEVIAEGVENDRQREVLVELGCTKAQGYLFSEAITGPELADRLRTAHRG